LPAYRAILKAFLWVNKMLKRREEVRSLREMLSFTKREADSLMEYLVSFRDRVERAHILLTDLALTAFFSVALAEALPIAVVTRFIQRFKDFGILVVIGPTAVTLDAAEFVRNRAEHVETIWREFDGSLRAIVPLFETEVRGVPMLQRLSDTVFAADGAAAAPAPNASMGRSQQAGARP
jgi:arsenite-transporting ATPase